MNFQCTKGFTTKRGKHYGYQDVISQEEYDDLTDEQKNNFVPEEDEDDEETPEEEEKPSDAGANENY
jgi:hypothetical protein